MSGTYSADADSRVVEAVAKIAEERGVPRAQIALAWVLAKSEVSAPIIGATKLHHLDDAVAALTIRLADASLGGLHSPKLLIRSGRLREITGILGGTRRQII
jgi:aryl-alcohol dehydrogenase-like predicted oxidoreductase